MSLLDNGRAIRAIDLYCRKVGCKPEAEVDGPCPRCGTWAAGGWERAKAHARYRRRRMERESNALWDNVAKRTMALARVAYGHARIGHRYIVPVVCK